MKTPDRTELENRFRELLLSAIPIETVGYRSVTLQYAREKDIISGEGSRKFGGRWNPPGIAAVYLSLSPETAMAETLAHFQYRGIPVSAAMPRVFVSVSVRLSQVVDITQKTISQRLQVSNRALLESDWRKIMTRDSLPPSQLVGQAAEAAGVEGLLVPSAASRFGKNLIIFPANLLPDSKISVDRADELPNNEA
ncbi:RES family NAD+ phosphorylase [Planctomicrobium piriforme]|uniref:RES domain-containing protein n=1 Tax=Planctomicrobium piriforme TaxID=1576369 RepID=A0A1I3DIP9_9PLAN|nr:RES family NAD+ phosphorylase [Planctomicrobium piriforme]SFH86624.1 RES domain-containing protein [Planctomicrobium piriforme]